MALSTLVDKRNLVHQLLNEAENEFASALGIKGSEPLAVGFEVRASTLFGRRRRLEATFHSQSATNLLTQFAQAGYRTEPLTSVSEKIWWMTRFKRVFSDGGTPYYSADELFTLNPTITKHVALDQARNAKNFFVKAGWLVMACSGQVYGMNGSVALITKHHETAFFSGGAVCALETAEHAALQPLVDFVPPGLNRAFSSAATHPTSGCPSLALGARTRRPDALRVSFGVIIETRRVQPRPVSVGTRCGSGRGRKRTWSACPPSQK